MFSLNLYIVVFLALTTTANGSRCLKCLKRNGDTCEGESVSCKGESQCFVISEYVNIGGQEFRSIAKGCAGEIPCDSSGYVKNKLTLIRDNVKCCSGDNCNTNNYDMPPDNGKPSGKVCSDCFKGNSLEECVSDQTRVCKHKEDKCVTYIGEFKDPAHGSSCLKCLKRNGDTCEGESVSCNGESQCMVISEHANIGGKVFRSIAKGCAEEIPCDSSSYVNNQRLFIRENVKCCSGDNCNTNNYHMPPDNGKPSGKVCPDCFKGNSLEECISDQTRVCKHKEDKCVSTVGQFIDPDGAKVQFSHKGCMSPSICKHGFDLLIGIQEISSSGLHCT
ncbi:urokinase plasminogen activator surface receptor-like [Ascaphus truei]|uniref:urokinase plasminogen activator surface receptor-like n=1 Tax=Ascaphus truei TaxID=8439 RepID=UPI003F59CF73